VAARRVVVFADEIAWLRRRNPRTEPVFAADTLPEAAPLGRADDGESVLLLRFSVPLPPEVTVVEAYVLLSRAAGGVAGPVSLHAARVVEPWRAEGLSWGRMPRVEEARGPRTWVSPTSTHLVRIDVSNLVRRWRSHDPRDQGIAIRADNGTTTGVGFWLSAPASEADPDEDDRARRPSPLDAGQSPRLELYVRAETPRGVVH
jgi:hypothetical protein